MKTLFSFLLHPASLVGLILMIAGKLLFEACIYSVRIGAWLAPKNNYIGVFMYNMSHFQMRLISEVIRFAKRNDLKIQAPSPAPDVKTDDNPTVH